MAQNTEWQVAAQAYLTRVGRAEHQAAVRANKGRKLRRFTPSDYLTGMCALLGQNDEEGFKARKMLEGYATDLGV